VKRLIILVMGLTAAAGAVEAPEWARPASVPDIEPVYALVDVNALNLRDAPAVDADKVGLLRRGDRVEVLAWAVGFDSRESDYVWAEVRSGDLHGYVAAEETSYSWGGFGERYLVVEHDFGESELELTADLDADGSPERVWVGPGKLFYRYEQCYYGMVYVYYLPLVLQVEGSFDAEVRLDEFCMDTVAKDTPEEELLNLLMTYGVFSWTYSNWSLYDLEAGDFNGDGKPDLRLTLDTRSCYPTPVVTPTFTRRRVLGFTWDGDGLRKIYGYTEQAFLPAYEDGPTGGWTHVEGGAELTPEVLRYHGLVCCPEERFDEHRFRPMNVHVWLSELDRVRHPLPPPNYLADASWYATDLEARWVPEAGIYALYCPPGNDYGLELAYEYSGVSPLGLLASDPSETVWGEVDEPLTLYCLPGSGDVAGTLEPEMWLRVWTFETRDGDWSIVAAFPYPTTHFMTDEPCLAGWTRTPPELKE
jgi:hypothetical protein